MPSKCVRAGLLGFCRQSDIKLHCADPAQFLLPICYNNSVHKFCLVSALLLIYCQIMSAVMIPISSTVIPLPVYKVGYGLGFISKDKKAQLSFKPEDNIKLITTLRYNQQKKEQKK
ncbi:hypothetical protein ACFW04_011705 [Cataglyphis niger]